MRKKYVLLVDLILIVGVIGAACAFYWFELHNSSVAFSPELELETSSVLLQFRDIERILIDDNADLTSPEIYVVSDGTEISFAKGIYYLGLESATQIEIRKFEIRAPAQFRLVKGADDVFRIVNSGNNLNVLVQRGNSEQRFLLEGRDNE